MAQLRPGVVDRNSHYRPLDFRMQQASKALMPVSFVRWQHLTMVYCSSGECVATKHSIYFPGADTRPSLENLGDRLGMANVKMTAHVM